MQHFLFKFKKIFLPYALTMLGLVLLYTLFNWLVFVKLDWGTMSDGVIEFIIPLLIVVVALALIMNPRLKLLYFKASNGALGLLLLMGLGIMVPLVMAQKYMVMATGEMTTLNNINEVDDHPKTKYYKFKQYYFYKKGVGMYANVYTSGKGNTTLNFDLYCATPILQQPSDALKGSTHYWLCDKYSDHLSNKESDGVKQKAYDSFIVASKNDYLQKQLHDYSFLERLENTSDTDEYVSAAGESYFIRDSADIFFVAHEEPFEDRCGNRLLWVFVWMGISQLLILVFLFFYKLQPAAALAKWKRKQQSGWWKFALEDYQWFLPREGFYSTLWLIYANVFVFVLMMMNGLPFTSFSEVNLIDWGSLFKPDTVKGEWWRLLTHLFVHNSFNALFSNLLSLFFVGLCLEPLVGKKRLLWIYFIGGLCGGISSLSWNYYVNTTGASAAIFSLYGFLLVLAIMRVYVFDGVLKQVYFGVATFSLALTLFLKFKSSSDCAADLGGLTIGLFFGAIGCETIRSALGDRKRR